MLFSFSDVLNLHLCMYIYALNDNVYHYSIATLCWNYLSVSRSVTAVVSSYFIHSLSHVQVLLLFHIIVDMRPYMHWIHRVILVFILLASVAFTICIDILWPAGFSLMRISLMVNHLGLSYITYIFNMFHFYKFIILAWHFTHNLWAKLWLFVSRLI